MGLGEERCDDYAGFECPLCGYRRYYRIVIQREGRPAYRTSFYGCSGCAAMGTVPDRFTQCPEGAPERFGSSSYGPR